MSANEIINILNTPLFGIGYLKLIENSSNGIKDYLMLDINTAFEELTGWGRDHILNKRASEIFDNINSGVFSWLSYFENVARSEKVQETVQWTETFKKYLKITVIPSDRVFLMIVIQQASGESAMLYQKNTDLLPEDVDAVFNNTHDAISLVEYSKDGFRYIRNNTVHQRLTGFSDIKGLSPVQLVGEEVSGKLIKYYEQCMNTGQPVSYEQEFNFAPGRRVWQTEVIPIFDNGIIRYLLCSSKDISELKDIQEEHGILTSRLWAMFEQHSALKVAFDAATGEIVDVNPAILKYFGYAKEEVLGKRVQEFNLLPSEIQDEKFQSELNGEILFSAAPHRLKSGETRFLDVYASAILDGRRRLLYAILFDVTDREHFREELLKEKELLQTTLESIGDGVVTTDNDGLITGLNLVAQELTGWNNNAAVGRFFTEVFILQNEDTKQIVENPIQKVLKTGRIVGLANHTELVNRCGQCIPISDSAAPIKSEDGQILGTVMVFRDVSSEKEHSRQIEFLSYHDHLTGLYNRRYIESIMSCLDAPENLPITIVMGDVNGLKLINDVFGHEAGDTLLKHVASLLMDNCRKSDFIARWGGDEFVVLMPRTSLKVAETVIQRFKDIHIPIDEGSLTLSLSIGCASKDAAGSSIKTLMREAEEYMYRQKLLHGKSYRNAIISTLLATLYEKSSETEEHSKRIEKYCHAIGRRLQLSSKEMDALSLLALLHDIGKVSINPNILQKPGSLTPEEWEEMKKHSEIGYRIARATPELAAIADLILSHHERWDGKGYPRGLKGEEIPLACRILAVVDALDAMTNDRVYRSAMTIGEAILELEKNTGKQFDPQTANLLIGIIVSEENEVLP